MTTPSTVQTSIAVSTARGKGNPNLASAKNEIYARHGRKFQASELNNYFNSLDWYHGTIEPDNFTESLVNQLFNDYEKQNSRYLSDVEASRGNYSLH